MLEKAVGALPLGFAQAEGVLDSAGSSLSYDLGTGSQCLLVEPAGERYARDRRADPILSRSQVYVHNKHLTGTEVARGTLLFGPTKSMKASIHLAE